MDAYKTTLLHIRILFNCEAKQSHEALMQKIGARKHILNYVNKTQKTSVPIDMLIWKEKISWVPTLRQRTSGNH